LQIELDFHLTGHCSSVTCSVAFFQAGNDSEGYLAVKFVQASVASSPGQSGNIAARKLVTNFAVVTMTDRINNAARTPWATIATMVTKIINVFCIYANAPLLFALLTEVREK
jgi:hypothetical protein